MTITGLPANIFYGLLGGAAAAVTILYLLKLRRRRVLVPFSPLWMRVIEEREATSLLKRLKRLLSWLVQLVFATLVILALADLRPADESKEQRFTVILVDSSASMQATDEKPTRLEKAKSRAKDLIRNLGTNERAMVVQVGAQAAPLGTFTKDQAALQAAVDQVKSSDAVADLGRALETVAASLQGRPNPRIVVFSDGRMPLEDQDERKALLKGIDVQGELIGKGNDNVAITSFNVRRYLNSPGEYEAYVEIRNYSDRPVTCNVTVSVLDPRPCTTSQQCPRGYECDRSLKTCANPQGVIPPVSITKRGVWRRIVGNLSSAGGRLVATVEPKEFKDQLPADNRAFAYLPPRRPARILLVATKNLFLEALLLLDPQNLVTKVTPAEYRPGGEFDLTIFDGVAPARGGKLGNYLYIAPHGPHSPLSNGRTPVMAPVVDKVSQKHPVLRWVALKDLNIVKATPFRTGRADRVLVTGVGKGGRDTPLLIAQETDKGKTLVFSFDLKESDLPLRWSFPILVPNIVAWMKGESREENSSYVTGRRWSIPVPRGVDKVTVVDPKGRRREAPVRDNHAQIFGAHAGFYEIYMRGEKKPSLTVAANLQSPQESDLRPPKALAVAGKAAGKVTRATIAEGHLWMYFVLAALVITMVEWLTYHRRITV